MTNDHIRMTEAVAVPLNTIAPHPENARRGDIDKIAESLTTHGQFKPLVVNQRDGSILAGNHTYKAAKRLKWKKIAVVYVDVDETTARKILLVDNRSSDRGSYNEPALRAMLEELPSLEGTGYTQDDVDNLDQLLDGPFAATTKRGGATPDDEYRLNIGPFKAIIDADLYVSYEEQLLEEHEQNRARIIKWIKEALRLPAPKPLVEKDPATLISPPETVTAELVAISTLRPYPMNPREGDIGAIAESLQELGQYRPIVARMDGLILCGNHTYQAAKMLGWTNIAVTWIACTDEEAAKIVLVDNRTADFATYDDTGLKRLITALPDWNGTGFTPTDVAEILNGGSSRIGPDTTGRTSCAVGNFKFRFDRAQLNRWAAGLTLADIGDRLNLPEQFLNPEMD